MPQLTAGWRPGRGGVLRRWAARRGDPERGAVTTVVAVLLAGGVLLGFLAIVVDVGQLYLEREQLQSGADASALAVARACANNDTACTSESLVTALAETYADDNAEDKHSRVAEICGRLPGVLPACSAPADNLTECIGTVPSGTTPYVEVRLATELADGRTVLPPAVVQTLAGSSGYTGAAVGACARATWEPIGAIQVLAMTMSVCEFNEATGGGGPPDGTEPGTDFGDKDAPDLAHEYTIMFWDSHFDGVCHSAEDPWDDPDWVALLDGGGTDCELTMPSDGVVHGDHSERIAFDVLPAACENRVRVARAGHEVVYIPLHDGQDDDHGAGVQFHHAAVAPFLITGFQFGPPVAGHGDHDEESYLHTPPRDPCLNLFERCLSGVFTGPPIPVADLATGAAVVRLVG